MLGFVREMVLAYGFGAGSATDAYLVAWTIPGIIFAILGGALVAGAVPLFTSYRTRWGDGEAWYLFSSMMTVLLAALAIFTLLGEVFARQLVWLITPGLPEHTAVLATELTRIVLPTVVFLALGNLYNGLLNANGIFGPPAFASVLTNILVIGGLVLGIELGITTAAWGILSGYAAAFILQVPYIRRVGFRYRPVWDLKHPGIKEAWALLVPVLVSSGLGQVYLIIDRILASGLPEGSITALNYAQKVALLPQGMLAVPLATAIFPALAQRAVGESEGDFSRALTRGVNLVFCVTVPLAVLLMVLARPTVELLFMRGAFDERAAAMTTWALVMFGIGMVAQCVNPILTRGFYARQDSATPLKCAVVAIALNLVLSLILIHPLKHAGLALANSLAATFNIFQLGWWLKRSTGGAVSFGGIRRDVVAALVAAGACGLAAWGCDWFVSGYFGCGTLGAFVRVATAGTAGIAVFALLAWILRISEIVVLAEKAVEITRRKIIRKLRGGFRG